MEVNPVLPHKVFAYGTLKRGQPNYFHLVDQKHGVSRFSGVALTETAYPLVITTQWNVPFLLDAPGKGQQIFGEIFDVDDRLLEFLDELEGHPEVYFREKISVSRIRNEAKGGGGGGCPRSCEEILGKTECWVYLMKKYPSQMLDLDTYSSYDAFGIPNKHYIPNTCLLTASDIELAFAK